MTSLHLIIYIREDHHRWVFCIRVLLRYENSRRINHSHHLHCQAEQTDEYAPPEVLFSTSEWIPFEELKPESYDSWSIGVVILEMLLGTPNVFSVDKRTTAVLTTKLKDESASDSDIRRALYLAALSQFCIYIPTSSNKDWPLREGDPLFQAVSYGMIHYIYFFNDTCS